tara:strand:+ start:42 stop:242 length:201 start_codon:yes stop_codon:yes gene_type:complete
MQFGVNILDGRKLISCLICRAHIKAPLISNCTYAAQPEIQDSDSNFFKEILNLDSFTHQPSAKQKE